MDLSPAVPQTEPLSRSSACFLTIGWAGVLLGLGLITAAAQMVDHPVVMGRFAPLFWAAPIWTILAATRRRSTALLSSGLGNAGLLLGAMVDISRHHPVAGRYELWLAGASLLVSVSAWLTRPLGPPAKPEHNLPHP